MVDETSRWALCAAYNEELMSYRLDFFVFDFDIVKEGGEHDSKDFCCFDHPDDDVKVDRDFLPLFDDDDDDEILLKFTW